MVFPKKKSNHEILLQAFWSLDKGGRDTPNPNFKKLIYLILVHRNVCCYQRTYQIKEKYRKVSEIISIISISSKNKQPWSVFMNHEKGCLLFAIGQVVGVVTIDISHLFVHPQDFCINLAYLWSEYSQEVWLVLNLSIEATRVRLEAT